MFEKRMILQIPARTFSLKNARISFERNKIRANIEMIDGTTQDSSYDVDMSAFMELPKQGI